MIDLQAKRLRLLCFYIAIVDSNGTWRPMYVMLIAALLLGASWAAFDARVGARGFALAVALGLVALLTLSVALNKSVITIYASYLAFGALAFGANLMIALLSRRCRAKLGHVKQSSLEALSQLRPTKG